MNDKWFNIAMIIVFTSFIANGLVFMLTAFPNGGTYDGVDYTGLHQDTLDYNTNNGSVKTQYASKMDTGSKISPTENDTFNPITTILGDPFGLSPLYLLGTAFIGLELMLLTLSQIFAPFAILFITVALIMFTVKALVIAYFAGILIRSLFGGRA
jgi:hypothetical protein